MITVHFIDSAGAAKRLQCKTGQSLMRAAVKANIAGIEGECGGMMTCATCHVYVREPHAGALPAPQEDEASMLEYTASPRRPNSRLCCQIQLTDRLDGLTVDLPGTQY